MMNLNSLDYDDYDAFKTISPKKTIDLNSKKIPIILNKKVDNIRNSMEVFNDFDTEENNKYKIFYPIEKIKLKKLPPKGATNSINLINQSDLKKKFEELRISANHSKEYSTNLMHITEEKETNNSLNLRKTNYSKVN